MTSEMLEYIKKIIANLKEEDVLYYSIEKDLERKALGIHILVKEEEDKKIIKLEFSEGVKTNDFIPKQI